MRQVPPFITQKHNYSCSLAVLRMALAVHGQNVSEQELRQKIAGDYREDYRNIWNPTIAKLAQMYGLHTVMYADWPLFRPHTMERAMAEYHASPETFRVSKYENPDDEDESTEPLPLAYKEMFEAVSLGCQTVFGHLTKSLLCRHLDDGDLVQTSVKLDRLYPGFRKVFHSILIYDHDDTHVVYHDPTYGEGLRCPFSRLFNAANDVGAAIIYQQH